MFIIVFMFLKDMEFASRTWIATRPQDSGRADSNNHHNDEESLNC